MRTAHLSGAVIHPCAFNRKDKKMNDTKDLEKETKKDETKEPTLEQVDFWTLLMEQMGGR